MAWRRRAPAPAFQPVKSHRRTDASLSQSGPKPPRAVDLSPKSDSPSPPVGPQEDLDGSPRVGGLDATTRMREHELAVERSHVHVAVDDHIPPHPTLRRPGANLPPPPVPPPPQPLHSPSAP